jgi:hypothetical protein
MIVGLTVGGIGLCAVGLGALLMWFFNYTMRKPAVHDGIGGKDTDNLMHGCLSMILGMFCLYVGIFVTIVGSIIVVVALATAPPPAPPTLPTTPQEKTQP